MRMQRLCEGLMLLCVAAGAYGGDYPAIKEGLWTTTTTLSGGNHPPQTGKMCNSTTIMQQVIDRQKKPDQPCRIVNMTHSGSVYTQQTECLVDGTVKKSTSITTFTGDTLVHTEIRHEGGALTVVSDSKYLGSCPAGMQPGDYVGDDGMKLNVLHPENAPTSSDKKP
ncbi:MAG TPA: DUF3617 family protein [Steroidobacteraceae bacterium]